MADLLWGDVHISWNVLLQESPSPLAAAGTVGLAGLFLLLPHLSLEQTPPRGVAREGWAVLGGCSWIQTWIQVGVSHSPSADLTPPGTSAAVPLKNSTGSLNP